MGLSKWELGLTNENRYKAKILIAVSFQMINF